jgi:hypothetical protein
VAVFASRRKLVALRVAVCLLLVAASQSALETYGCACASRTYTAEEIATYRAGAAKGDLADLAQMEEYYSWRSWEHDEGSLAFRREDRRRQYFRDRRLALRDPIALHEEANNLMSDAAFNGLSRTERLTALRQARAYIRQLPRVPLTTDRRDPLRRDIDAIRYLDREIGRLLAIEEKARRKA